MSSTILVSRLPHGFFEDQMRGFFGQFGDIKRMRLSRNRKTGKSKHFAFIQFESPEIATIVADTMNDYLMYGRAIQCRVMALEDLHDNTFKGSDRKYVPIKHKEIEIKSRKKERTPEESEMRNERLKEEEKKKKRRFKELGINYSFPGYLAALKKIRKK